MCEIELWAYTVRMKFYDTPLWRPPSEGQNLILQATLGCSFNGCTFCSMYKSKRYVARPLDDVFTDIEAAAKEDENVRRVFLADGDALALPTDEMGGILDRLAATFSGLQRVTCYATPQNLNKKSVEDLRLLNDKRLKMVYFGLESGSQDILKRIHKGSPQAMERALAKANQAGLKVSATVILGLGGSVHWRDHIAQTANLINRQPPRFLSTLQLGLDEDVEGEFLTAFKKGGDAFQWQDDEGILEELERLLESLNPPRPIIFRSNHASNCLPLAGTLPKDTARLLGEVRAAKADLKSLRPNHLRGF